MTAVAQPKLRADVSEFFPYPSIRPHQDLFINTILEAVETKRHALIEGSNGLGKTISALSACLPVAKEKGLKILYVAKTHRQHERVIEELNAVAKRQDVSGLSVRGRTEMCFHPFILRHAVDAGSASEICESLKARHECPHYENIEKREKRFAELQNHVTSRPYKASEVQEICKVEKFCPYELVKKALPDVDVIALSYMYVFDPPVRRPFLKHLDKPLSEVILIVDEAHNLPETAVEIASDSLTEYAMRQAQLEGERFQRHEMAAFAEELKALTERIAERVEKETYVSPAELIESLSKAADIGDPKEFLEEMHKAGGVIRQQLLSEGKYPRSFVHRVSEFLLKWLETKENIAYTHVLGRYMARTGGQSAKLEVVALDPAEITEPVFSSVYCSVNMSGTLQPLEAYVKVTKLPDSTICEAVPSPFPEEHILSLACLGVTTAMEQRTPEMYSKLVRRLAEVVHNTPANLGIFTASYEVLERLREAGIDDYFEKPLFREHRGMKSHENERLIHKFKSYAKRGGAVLLGVQGGRSSEGADYPGDEMNSVAVVGVPYAEPTPKVKAQIRYFEERFPEHGREYGYVVPALKKAAQAAGRPIRTLEDRGAIVFFDQRYATSFCQRYLPGWLRRGLKILPDHENVVAAELRRFYNVDRD